MRSSRRNLALLLPALAAVTACADMADPSATAAASGARECFRPAQVNGFNPEGEDVVYLRIGARDIYRAEILAVCPDIDWSNRIGIRARGGGSWICQGLDAELIVPGPDRVDRCPITDIRKLSPDEVLAYHARR
jgi:hypothetical protein